MKTLMKGFQGHPAFAPLKWAEKRKNDKDGQKKDKKM